MWTNNSFTPVIHPEQLIPKSFTGGTFFFKAKLNTTFSDHFLLVRKKTGNLCKTKMAVEGQNVLVELVL